MKVLLVACMAVFFSLIAHADTMITLKNTDAAMPDKILIKNGRVLITEPNRESRMIFDTNTDTIYVIDDSKKEYIAFTATDMENISNMMNSMQSMMDGMLDQVSAEQRAQIEAMMGGSPDDGSQANPASYQIVKTGKSKTISGFHCDIIQLQESNITTTEVCIASQKTAKMNTDDYKTLIKMSKISQSFIDKFSHMAGEHTDGLISAGQIINQINGIPVEMVSGNDRSIMTSITESAITNGVFGLNGYQQIDLIQMQ